MNLTTTAVTIKAPAEDWYECDCGNMPHFDGFIPATADGSRFIHHYYGPIPGTVDDWDGKHLMCGDCGRVMDQSTYNAESETVNVVTGPDKARVTAAHAAATAVME